MKKKTEMSREKGMPSEGEGWKIQGDKLVFTGETDAMNALLDFIGRKEDLYNQDGYFGSMKSPRDEKTRSK